MQKLQYWFKSCSGLTEQDCSYPVFSCQFSPLLHLLWQQFSDTLYCGVGAKLSLKVSPGLEQQQSLLLLFTVPQALIGFLKDLPAPLQPLWVLHRQFELGRADPDLRDRKQSAKN